MRARVRVTPFGSLIADSARGLFMGNRGCLHDDAGNVTREIAPYRGRPADDVILLTPPTMLAAFRSGYRPVVHASAVASQ